MGEEVDDDTDIDALHLCQYHRTCRVLPMQMLSSIDEDAKSWHLRHPLHLLPLSHLSTPLSLLFLLSSHKKPQKSLNSTQHVSKDIPVLFISTIMLVLVNYNYNSHLQASVTLSFTTTTIINKEKKIIMIFKFFFTYHFYIILTCIITCYLFC